MRSSSHKRILRSRRKEKKNQSPSLSAFGGLASYPAVIGGSQYNLCILTNHSGKIDNPNSDQIIGPADAELAEIEAYL
jgi:hypothetical protein